MVIREIKVKNFRCYAEAEVLDLSQFNVVAGGNYSGKSTLLDALAVGFTGTCRGADTGIGLKDLRRLGSSRRWMVQLELSRKKGDKRIQRTEGEGPKSQAQEIVSDYLGVPSRQIRACLYAQEILRMDRKAAQRLVLDLTRPEGVTLPERVVKLASSHLMAMSTADTCGLAELERLHDMAYKKRTEASRALRELGDASTPTPPAGYQKLKGLSLEELDRQVELTDRKIEQYRTEQGQRRIEAANLENRASTLQQKLLGARQALSELSQGQEMPDREALKKACDDLVDRIKACEGAREAARAKADELRGELGEAEGERKRVAYFIETVKVKGGQAAGQCLVCKTKLTDAKRKAMSTHLEGWLSGVVARVTKLRSQLRSVDEQMQTQGNALGQAEREFARLEGVQEQLLAREAKRSKLETQASELQKSLEDAESESRQRLPEITQQIEDLDKRIERGKALRRDIAAYAAAVRHVKSQVDRHAALTREHTELEELVRALGPKGAQAELAGDNKGLESFVHALNTGLSQVEFQVDMSPLLSMQGDISVRGVPARMLSRSERMLFGASFAIVAASWSGLNVVALDDFEHLDPQHAKLCMGLLRQFPGQVFMFQVLRDRDKLRAAAAQASSDYRFYLVERTEGNGSLVRRLP